MTRRDATGCVHFPFSPANHPHTQVVLGMTGLPLLGCKDVASEEGQTVSLREQC